MQEGMLLIISGPSGSGKGTVTKKLSPDRSYALSVSMTTRNKRPGEIDGVDYIFCSKQEFRDVRDCGGFLEHAAFSNNYYGTPISYVNKMIAKGLIVVMEIDVVGALQVKSKYPEAILVFLMPPTFTELSCRLANRGTEDAQEINSRLRRAWDELRELEKYDYLVINNDIDNAVKEIDLIVDAERLRPKRSSEKIDHFMNNA